ncbi:MAG TPA: DUF2442 domain-containing protein, partial [Anaerolineales bacterium]|nr:DUF2442 domain-containing protein [Anaerolineales bacterium]
MNPYVKSVQTQENYCLLLTFENGEKRIFDLKPFLDKGIFARLKDVAWFKTARVVSGSVEWRGEIDLSYDTLYLSSVPVKTNKNRLKASQKAKKKLATITSKRNKR